MIRDVSINTNTPNVIDKSFVSEQAEKKNAKRKARRKCGRLGKTKN